ncbi:unnamed protein product [marine sediment metagenome]|uniref:Uncharacterized protein n=1 Tax=marine sediment metagenome TaxID=412755 RepID=X1C3F6_9ZZZZ
MEGELIFLGFMMLIGQIILLQMWNNNWFKKENFKMQKSKILAENRIKLKKMERDLGLTASKEPREPPTMTDTVGNLAGLLPLLKNLDGDQISALADRFLGGSEPTTEGGDVTDMLIDYASRNPDMVEALLGGLKSGGKQQDGEQQKLLTSQV